MSSMISDHDQAVQDITFTRAQFAEKYDIALPELTEHAHPELVAAFAAYRAARDLYLEADTEALGAEGATGNASRIEGELIAAAVRADEPLDQLPNVVADAERELRHAARKLQVRAADLRTIKGQLFTAIGEHGRAEINALVPAVEQAGEQLVTAFAAVVDAREELNEVAHTSAWWYRQTTGASVADSNALSLGQFTVLDGRVGEFIRQTGPQLSDITRYGAAGQLA